MDQDQAPQMLEPLGLRACLKAFNPDMSEEEISAAEVEILADREMDLNPDSPAARARELKMSAARTLRGLADQHTKGTLSGQGLVEQALAVEQTLEADLKSMTG